MEFIQGLWDGILNPGTTPALVIATHASFACLELVLFLMLWASRSLHFVALIILATCLWMAITWFIGEAEAYRQKEGEKSPKPDQQNTNNAEVSSKEPSSTSVKRRARKI